MEKDKKIKSQVWQINNTIRGSLANADLKSYIFGFLFYRFLSEKIINFWGKSYPSLYDKEAETYKEKIINNKGYFIPPSELFCNVLTKKSDYNSLSNTLQSIFINIEMSAKNTPCEHQIKGLLTDIDLNNKKLGASEQVRNDTLFRLLDGIYNIKYDTHEDVDIFGDIYEFLSSMYATNAGKSGGEFYTPINVSKLLAKISTLSLDAHINNIYDPTCGSGSLLLQTNKIIKEKNLKIKIFGQEINPISFGLCRMNMFLHDIHYNDFNINWGNTLTNPCYFNGERFNIIVSNPPYSINWEGDKTPSLIKDERFAPANKLAPKSKADLAFMLHSLHLLAPNGIASFVMFPGVLYRGGSEQQIRKYLVDYNFIDSIINLPSNVFFGTSISTCIVTLKKNKLDNNICFIDASSEFVKDGNKNTLSEDNINNILNYYVNRGDKKYISTIVDNTKIKENSYNLSASQYIDPRTKQEEINIDEIEEELLRVEIRRKEIIFKLNQAAIEAKNYLNNRK